MGFSSLVCKFVKFQRVVSRSLCTHPQTLLVECLKSRTLISVSGDEVDDYLQGLISNDIKHLKEGSPSMYSMFLNSKGRILHDSIIYNTDQPKTFFVECDSTAVDLLVKHLLMYRVRRKINIDSLQDKLSVWCVCDKHNILNSEDKNKIKLTIDVMKPLLRSCLICCDPRIGSLGLRVVAPKDIDVIGSLSQLTDFQVMGENFYKNLRYKLGVAEGVTELPPGNCFPLEANCDYMHGVSFHKGCYIGQELTARTYHTGVVRKRIMPIVFNEHVQLSEGDAAIVAENAPDKPIGKLRGAEGTVGIGLLRIHEALTVQKLLFNGKELKTHSPSWWPAESEKRKTT